MGRGATAIAAIESVLGQLDDGVSELLVLDNDCDVELERAVQARAAGSAGPVTYHAVPDIGLHNGRHAAVREGSGDVLAYLDDDVVVEPGWLQSLTKAFADPDVHLVGGPCHPRYEDVPPNWLNEFWSTTADARWCAPLSLVDAGDVVKDIDPMLVFGANFAIRRSTLVRVGGFHPDALPWALRMFRGDGESWVSSQVRSLGLRALYHPGAAVQHRVPAERMTDAYLERRAFIQGISDAFTDTRSASGSDTRLRSRPMTVRSLVGGVVRSVPSGRNKRRRAFEAAHAAGYRYHQDQVLASRIVREWVARPDYWDGRVPQDSES